MLVMTTSLSLFFSLPTLTTSRMDATTKVAANPATRMMIDSIT